MKKLFAILSVMAVFFLTSCKDPQNVEEPVLKFDKAQTTYSIGAEGGSLEVTVSTNLDITPSSNVAWIECTQTKAVEKKTLSIKVQENKDYEPRTGVVTVKGGEKTIEITVEQAAAEKPVEPEDPDELTADKTEYHVGAEGGKVEVTVNTNVDVTATPAESWVKYSSTKAAAAPKTLVFDVEVNTEVAARTCKVTLAGGDKSVEITISQDGEEVALSAAEATYQVPAEGADITVKVTTNIEYTIECDAEWISRAATKTSREDNIVFTVAPSTVEEARTATISFKYGDIIVKVTVSQAAYVPPAVMDLSDAVISLPAEGGEFSLVVTTNRDFTVESMPDWISRVETKATKEYQVVFAAEANTGAEREGIIVFKYEDQTIDVKVKQQAFVPVLTLSTHEASLPVDGGSFKVAVTSNVEYTVECADEWITPVETEEGYEFTVAANKGLAREGKVYFKYGELTEVVTVSQEKYDAPLADNIEIIDTDIPVVAGRSVQLDYKLTGTYTGLTVKAVTAGGWEASVKAKSNGKGTVTVTCPENGAAGTVALNIVKKDGSYTQKPLSFKVIPQGKKMTWMTYYTAYNARINPTNFQKMAEAGVTYVHTYGGDLIKDVYRASAGTGIKVVGYMQDFIYDYLCRYDPNKGDVFHPENDMPLEEYREMIKNSQELVDLVNYYKQAAVECGGELWGYSIIDEPNSELYPVTSWFTGEVLGCHDHIYDMIGILVDRLHELDPGRPTYINLTGSQIAPDIDTENCMAAGYDALNDFITRAHPDFVSFDQYPCGTKQINQWWYTRLESLYQNCIKKFNMPWWGYIATCDIDWDGADAGCPPPTLGSLRAQTYGNLAYGASGLELFTWEALGSRAVAPLLNNDTPEDPGHHGETYDMVKQVSEEVNARMFIFDGADIKWIRHSNGATPAGCTSLGKYEDPIMPEAVPAYYLKQPCFVSYIENAGNEYMLIVNKSHVKTVEAYFTFSQDVYEVGKDGSLTLVKAEMEDGEFVERDYEIDNGDVLIFKIK